jgi:L-malate glycosyltransferase
MRPLRIAYVVAYFYPFQSGAERQALLQGAELVRRGHDVRVITQFPVGSGIPTHEEIQGIRVERVLSPDRRGRRFGPSFVRQVVRALRDRRNEIDLVHTHQALWEAVGTGSAKAVGFRPPTLVQPASSGYYGEAEELGRMRLSGVLRRLILRNTSFVAISADIETQWRMLGVPADRIHRIASGVDTSRFHPATATREGPPVVAFTGRLHPQKNLDVLIRAWPDVVANHRARLRLIGDGPERCRLEALVRSLGIEAFVEFLGAVEDPSPMLREAELFALPSLCEGMSNSLLEALASGLPGLVSDVGGNRDLVTDGTNGLLLPTDDPAAWSVAINRLIRDPQLRLAMSLNARRGVESNYSIERVVDRYIHLYREILGERRA